MHVQLISNAYISDYDDISLHDIFELSPKSKHDMDLVIDNREKEEE